MGKAADNHGMCVSVPPRRKECSVGIHWESNSVCGHNLATACTVVTMQMEIDIEGLLIAEMYSVEYLPWS